MPSPGLFYRKPPFSIPSFRPHDYWPHDESLHHHMPQLFTLHGAMTCDTRNGGHADCIAVIVRAPCNALPVVTGNILVQQQAAGAARRHRHASITSAHRCMLLFNTITWYRVYTRDVHRTTTTTVHPIPLRTWEVNLGESLAPRAPVRIVRGPIKQLRESTTT